MCQVHLLLLRSSLGGDGGFVGGGEKYHGLYDIVFPIVRHNIDMPRFKNKKRGEVCGWISLLFIIQCLLINHAVLMSGSLSTNEPLIEYLYE